MTIDTDGSDVCVGISKANRIPDTQRFVVTSEPLKDGADVAAKPNGVRGQTDRTLDHFGRRLVAPHAEQQYALLVQRPGFIGRGRQNVVEDTLCLGKPSFFREFSGDLQQFIKWNRHLRYQRLSGNRRGRHHHPGLSTRLRFGQCIAGNHRFQGLPVTVMRERRSVAKRRRRLPAGGALRKAKLFIAVRWKRAF